MTDREKEDVAREARSVSSGEPAGRLGAEAAFCRDIAEADHEDVLQRMFEPLYGNPQDGVTILNHDRIDAINSVAEGIIEYGGQEYWFCIEDGNNNGSVLAGWNEAGQQAYEVPRPVQHALAPPLGTICNHIGRERFLLAKWDALLACADVNEIARKYDYDRYFQPGSLTDRHWRSAAERRGFEIVDRETALARRQRLEEAARSEAQDTQRGNEPTNKDQNND